MAPGEVQSFACEIGTLQNALQKLQQRVRQADAKIGQLRGQLAMAPRRQTADQVRAINDRDRADGR